MKKIMDKQILIFPGRITDERQLNKLYQIAKGMQGIKNT
jgi:hypothetical protein